VGRSGTLTGQYFTKTHDKQQTLMTKKMIQYRNLAFASSCEVLCDWVRKGLKIPRRQLRAGSSPAPGTNKINDLVIMHHLA